jgi:hypothetical protein
METFAFILFHIQSMKYALRGFALSLFALMQCFGSDAGRAAAADTSTAVHSVTGNNSSSLQLSDLT